MLTRSSLLLAGLLSSCGANALLTLNYSSVEPEPRPANETCTVIARVFRQDQRNLSSPAVLWDSAPVCAPGAGLATINATTVTENQALPNITLTWVAYGPVGGDDPKGRLLPTTKAAGCIYVNANMSSPCLTEHWALPNGTIMINPWNKTAGDELWVQPRLLTSEPLFPNVSTPAPEPTVSARPFVG